MSGKEHDELHQTDFRHIYTCPIHLIRKINTKTGEITGRIDLQSPIATSQKNSLAGFR